MEDQTAAKLFRDSALLAVLIVGLLIVVNISGVSAQSGTVISVTPVPGTAKFTITGEGFGPQFHGSSPFFPNGCATWANSSDVEIMIIQNGTYSMGGELLTANGGVEDIYCTTFSPDGTFSYSANAQTSVLVPGSIFVPGIYEIKALDTYGNEARTFANFTPEVTVTLSSEVPWDTLINALVQGSRISNTAAWYRANIGSTFTVPIGSIVGVDYPQSAQGMALVSQPVQSFVANQNTTISATYQNTTVDSGIPFWLYIVLFALGLCAGVLGGVAYHEHRKHKRLEYIQRVGGA